MDGGGDEREVSLRPGEAYELTLASLGTAGYAWLVEVEGDTSALEVSKARAAPTRGGGVGRSTSEVLSIAALASGEAVVRLRQARPWEQDVPARASIVLRVRVADG